MMDIKVTMTNDCQFSIVMDCEALELLLDLCEVGNKLPTDVIKCLILGGLAVMRAANELRILDDKDVNYKDILGIN